MSKQTYTVYIDGKKLTVGPRKPAYYNQKHFWEGNDVYERRGMTLVQICKLRVK